jgi:asparagine synthase (glutamine-hydrolysing)
MCGIAGFIDTKLSTEVAEKTIGAMLESIAHRGPDARSTWVNLPVVLGHNRLSIIDLSPDGTQPMHYFDSAIVFNGEIYNYIEVREELIAKGYKFSTQSDTEVILAAYREYGQACVDKFLGMWAFALWDKKKNELFCSRDRFGIKPFYYILDNGRFYFGSEYKALKKSPLFSKELNLDQVSRGLQLGWVSYNDETYYSSLKSIPAASNLIYKNGEISIEQYWDIEKKKVQLTDVNEAKHKLLELLKDSVSIHMRSDVEIAICLSGGIDSSSLSSLIATLYPDQKFKSYSIYYDGKNEVDERPYINEVIEKYPSIVPHYYKPSHDEMMERFHSILYQVDVPSTGSSNFSHSYLIEKIHADGIKVVIDGQGADEYLAGYMHSIYRNNADSLRKLHLKEFLVNVLAIKKHQKQSIGDLVSSLGKTALSVLYNEMNLYSLEYKNYLPFAVKKEKVKAVPFDLNNSYADSRLNEFLYQLLFTSSLPTILHYVDRMTMSHSVESRVPLLDHRLVEFGFSLKNELKFHKGVTKYILRESVKDILPSKIYNRMDKKGFVTPGEVNWLRGPMKNLLEIDYTKLDFLNKEIVKGVIQGYQKGDNKNSKLVWRIATLNYWINNFN